MNPNKGTARFLGAAFLIQAVASAVSGLFLLQPLIDVQLALGTGLPGGDVSATWRLYLCQDLPNPGAIGRGERSAKT